MLRKLPAPGLSLFFGILQSLAQALDHCAMLRKLPALGLFLFFGILLSSAQALDHCASGSTEVNGNRYCQAVQRIAYENIGATGTYNKVDGMSTDNGGFCNFTPFTYSGVLAPFDEDLSIHLRGPIELKQFAVYVPSQSVLSLSKRDDVGESTSRSTVTTTTTATVQASPVVTVTVVTIVTVSINDCGSEASPTLTQHPSEVQDPPQVQSSSNHQDPSQVQDPPQVPASASSPSAIGSTIPSKANPGDWKQTGYYNPDDKVSNGFVFLNNLGGSQSGDWNTEFGGSLAFASSDGQGSAASPQMFGGHLPTNTEIAIFSDTECDASCGFTRPKSPAYKGFNGAEKLFMMEFDMPDDNASPGGTSFNRNMPAVWALNAQIPRVGQYLSQAGCSCWSTGCGELDMFEVLDSGDYRMTSTVHRSSTGAGCYDYFTRPNGTPMKAAVLMSNNTIVIQILPSSFDFSTALTAEQVSELFSDNKPGMMGSTVRLG